MSQSGPRRLEAVLDARYTLTEKGLAATESAKVVPIRTAAPVSERERILAPLRAFHDAWGDTPTGDLDPTVLWEDLGALLHRLSQEPS